MKYRVDLTIEGYIEIDAESTEEARAKCEDGYSLSAVNVETDEINEITEVKED